MRNFLGFVYILLSLIGCDVDPSSTTTMNSSINGEAVNSIKARTWDGVADFDCIASSSGSCKIVVFLSDCPASGCLTKIIESFSVPAGSSRKMQNLPSGFKYCIRYDRAPQTPDCSRVPTA